VLFVLCCAACLGVPFVSASFSRKVQDESVSVSRSHIHSSSLHKRKASTILPLSERLERVRLFEAKMAELAKRKIPGKVAVEYKVDSDIIKQEAQRLVKKFGETMEFYTLGFSTAGITHGLWTCLSLRAVDGDMCDDSSRLKTYNNTLAWYDAPHTTKVLEPIAFALKRVRLSIMHPATMVSWHCDDCPGKQMAPAGCDGHQDPAKKTQKWKNGFHNWVRLHLMLDDNKDIDFALGGEKIHGVEKGNFFLANVAMPHRVDNKGDSIRTAMLVDVQIGGNRKRLSQSELGRSILQALHKVETVPKARDTYVEMGKALYKYRCDLSTGERYETEWHSQLWSIPLWRPLPPFQNSLFNSHNRCGIWGPLKNKDRVEKIAWSKEDLPGFRAKRIAVVQKTQKTHPQASIKKTHPQAAVQKTQKTHPQAAVQKKQKTHPQASVNKTHPQAAVQKTQKTHPQAAVQKRIAAVQKTHPQALLETTRRRRRRRSGLSS